VTTDAFYASNLISYTVMKVLLIYITNNQNFFLLFDHINIQLP